ncbi:MAG: hypothetical protein NT062_25700 [Proteobacteria bacterium]|nr:hypothetical protein [Pseudomonadota bacterium]
MTSPRSLVIVGAFVGAGVLVDAAARADRVAPPVPMELFTGTFQPSPADVVLATDRLDVIAHAGAVQILTAGTAPLADGRRVVIVQPLVGLAIQANVEKAHVQLPGFLLDRRPHHDGVFVVANPPRSPVFVTPTTLEVSAIRAVIAKAGSLEGVSRALEGLEVGAVDLDGDRAADLASTYGCTVWGDGRCQVTGQFLLARRGTRWAIIE